MLKEVILSNALIAKDGLKKLKDVIICHVFAGIIFVMAVVKIDVFAIINMRKKMIIILIMIIIVFKVEVIIMVEVIMIFSILIIIIK